MFKRGQQLSLKRENKTRLHKLFKDKVFKRNIWAPVLTT